MTIGPAKASVQVLSDHRGRNTGALPSAPFPGTDSFGSILAAPLPGSGSDPAGTSMMDRGGSWLQQVKDDLPRIEMAPSAQHYSSETHVADGAIAFHARPIVAPCAVTMEAESLVFGDEALPVRSYGFEPIAPRQNPAGVQRLDERSDAAPSDYSFGSPVAPVSSLSGYALPLPAATGTTLSANPAVTIDQPIVHARTAPEIVLRVQQREIPVPGRTQAQTMQQTPRIQLFAHLIASAQEYRVTVRGAALAQEDQERLASEIRASLQDQGLPDRPVVLIVSGGNS